MGWSPLNREGLGSDAFWRTVNLLEDLEYDSLWLSDTTTRPGLAPLPLLAAVAARTEALKLGTSVLVTPPRQPVLLAKELATIDALSNGRLLPAFGLGSPDPVEAAALGVPRDERAARLEEGLAVLRALWPAKPTSFAGRYCAFQDVTLSPRPTRARLEVWLGGSSKAVLRLTGRIADGWLGSFVTPDDFATQVTEIRRAAAEAGRAIDEDHYGTIVFAAQHERESRAFIERIASARRRAAPAPHEIVGTGVDGVRALLERFRRAGATKFVLIPLAPEERFLRELKSGAVDPVEIAR